MADGRANQGDEARRRLPPGVDGRPAPPGPHIETLTVPTLWWLLGGLFALVVFWVFLLASPLLVAVVAAVVAVVLVGALLSRYGSARVATDPDGFTAGRALLPYRYIGVVEPLDEEATRRLIGVEADARAYLLVRTYCRGAVKVSVEDPADPTPYWVVSTRRPFALATSLGSRRVRD